MNYLEELDRITHKPIEQKPPGFLAVFEAYCQSDPHEVLSKVEETLSTVLKEVAVRGWPEPHEWVSILPLFFVETFNQRVVEDEDWDIESWLYWFKPENRTWRWWSGSISGRDSFKVTVLVDGFPFAWGALEYLLRSCGAFHVEESSV